METEWLWLFHTDGRLYLLAEDTDGDASNLAGIYPDAVYFLAGVSPVPLED